MMQSFSVDPSVSAQVQAVLEGLARGLAASDLEGRQVDCKEEPGRRTRGGDVLPGATTNDEAARFLADEMAALANTSGGGAIVLGVADDGEVLGTELSADWLRHRIYEISQRKLTVDIRHAELRGERLLVLTTHEAVEPIPNSRGKYTWRVDSNTVEIDPTSWHASRLQRSGFDWSAQRSEHLPAAASALAFSAARHFLDQAIDLGDQGAADLRGASDEDLLRRLNVLHHDGVLTNAGALLFVDTPGEAIDYIRREVPSAPSTARVRGAGPLLAVLRDVDLAVELANRTIFVDSGLVRAQTSAIPPDAAREAVVNAVTHRDWLTGTPTVVEHIGDTLTVTSPGGFPLGTSADNIITHPSNPRYRSLAEALAKLRVAEREGVGVDRMVRDMLAAGHPQPVIVEGAGPTVRVVLIGGEPDDEMRRVFALLQPPAAARSIDIALIIEQVSSAGFVDERSLAPLLQRTYEEAGFALRQAAEARLGDKPLLKEIADQRPNVSPVYGPSEALNGVLAARYSERTSLHARAGLLMRYARHRGHITSGVAAVLIARTISQAAKQLAALEEAGELAPGRPNRRGRGFFYVPA